MSDEPHTSPPGTYERLWKDLHEDPALTDAEVRLIMYLATLPDGWEIHSRQLQAALGRSANWVKMTLRALARRGIVYTAQPRNTAGTFTQAATRVRRGRIVALGDLADTNHREADFPPTGACREADFPPTGSDQGLNGKTAGRNREGVQPSSGEASHLERTHRPRDDSQGQNRSTGGTYAVPPDPPAARSRAPERDPRGAHCVVCPRSPGELCARCAIGKPRTIRDWLTARNMTMKTAAAAAQMSPLTVSNVCRGRGEPASHTRLAAVLDLMPAPGRPGLYLYDGPVLVSTRPATRLPRCGFSPATARSATNERKPEP